MAKVRETRRRPGRWFTVLGMVLFLASMTSAAKLPQQFNHSFDVDAATVMACTDGALFTGEPTAASALNIQFTGQVWNGTGTTLLATGDTHTFTAIGETYTFTVMGSFTVGSTILVQANNVPGTFPSTQGDAATATVADCSIAVPAMPGVGLLLLGLALVTLGATLAGRTKWNTLARGGAASIAAIAVTTLALGSASPAWGSSTPPEFSKVFAPDTIGPGSTSTLTFTITNPNPHGETELAFTDTLPAGVTIADPASASTDCAAGGAAPVLTAPDGGTTISLSSGAVSATASCTVQVDVTSSTPGTHINTSGDLTSSAGNSGTASDDLTVTNSLPGFSKSFSPSTVSLGGRSTLTFVIDNSANASSVPNLDFTDNLPSGMVIASPANASTTCGTEIIPPTLTATPGSGVVVLDADGVGDFPAVAAGANCTVTVDVVATAGGELDNVSDNLFAEFVEAGKASDTLEVTVTKIALEKKFLDDPVPPGGSVLLEFTVHNFDRDSTATDVAFTDDLKFTPSMGLSPVGLPLMGACGAGSTLTETGGVLSLTGGTIAPESFCVFSITLDVPAGETIGVFTNTTSAVTATIDGVGEVGNMASDDLFVEPAPVLTKEFLDATTLTPDPVVGAGDDVVIRFTVTNTSTTSGATDIAFLDDITSFFPFGGASVLPSDPCGGGSSIFITTDFGESAFIELLDGSLAAAGMTDDSCTFDVTLTLPMDLAAGVYVNTTDPVTATVDGATRTGDSASDDFTVVSAPALLKEFTDDPAQPGGTVTLEFTLSHDDFAPGDASGVTFTDNLSFLTGLTATGLPIADLCGPGNGMLAGSSGDTLLTVTGVTLTPGETCVFSVTLDVPAGAAPGDHTNTTSSVMATVLGATATSPPAEDDLEIAGLSLSKEFTDDPVIAGGTVTLEFTIENLTVADDATAIFFTDNLDAALDDLAVAPASVPTDPCGAGSSITLSSGDRFLTFSGGSLMAGESCTFSVTLDVPAAAADDTYGNVTSSLSASLGGSGFTGDPAFDELVVNSTLLVLDKEFIDDPVGPGDGVTLRFTLTNLDPVQAASAIAFTDDLEATLSGLVATGLPKSECGGTVAAIPDASTIDFSGGTLAADSSCAFDVELSVPGSAPLGTVAVNTTSVVTGTIGGLGVAGSSATDELRINRVTFTKAFDGPTTATGTAVLTFTLKNVSTTDPINDLDFTDDLGDVITGLTASGLPAEPCGTGSAISGTSFLTFSDGTLPPGGMCSFSVTVNVPVTAMAGSYNNVTSELTQIGLTVAAPATADLVIEPPPTFAKVFAPDSIIAGLVSTLTFTIDNSASAIAASSLAFVDNLPTNLVVASPSNVTGDCGGAAAAPSGGSSIEFSGGTVGAGASCTISIDVTSVVAGTYLNTTDDLTSSSGNSGTASDTLTVIAPTPPTFAKDFAPNPIVEGEVSTLTFTIDNSASTVAATSLAFVDNLPAGVEVASPSNVTGDCGGTLTAPSGGTSIDFSGGTVGAGASCTVSIDVTSAVAGMYTNTTGDLTSSSGNSGTASDTLTVNAAPPPTFTKVFSPNPVGDTFETTLTFTIDNSASALAANDLAFLDTLPFDLQVASVPMVANTCGGSVVAMADGVSISLSGGSVAAGASCTISVKVFAPSVGTFVNTTGDLTSSLGNSGTATDTLTVGGCTAADGSNLTLGSDIVLAAETYEVCNTIEVQEHFQVLGPNGALTLRAGVAVVIFNGVSVEQNGELTIEIDPSLIP